MINDNTILSSFDDKPTLLEWLKKVEDALKTDTAKSISVENPSANTYVFKITFADGKTLSSGNVVFPDSVKDVSIKNGHIIVTSVGGNVEDLGVLNPYAETIVLNSETNTTEIGNNVEVDGNLQVNSNETVSGGLSVEGALSAKGGIVTAGKVTANDGMEVHGQGYVNGALGVTGNATIGGTITAGGKAINAVEANPTGVATETLEKLKIGNVAYNVGGGGGGGSAVENIIANGTYVGEDSGMVINSFSLTSEQREKIKRGNVLSISGKFALSNGETSYGASYIGTTSNECGFSGLNISGAENLSIALTIFPIPKNDEYEIEAYFAEFLMIPPLPSDSATKTYALKSVNGILTWVEG